MNFKKKMTKKGNYPDISEYIMVALVVSFSIIIMFNVISNFDSSIQSMNESVVTNTTKNISSEFKQDFLNGFDNGFLIVYILFLLFSVVAARFIPSSPKFIWVTIIILMVLCFVAMIVENIWGGMADNITLSSTISQFTFIPFMMEHLTYLTLIYGLFVAVALLTKSEDQILR